jgi:hypothetical protein
VNERSLRRHWDAAFCGKLFRMITAMQAFGWRHQYSIGYLLIARDGLRIVHILAPYIEIRVVGQISPILPAWNSRA